MPDIAQFLHLIKLPVMPEAGCALIRTLNDENADIPMVRNIIAKDPALTTMLLRMANSALFGLSRRVDTLDSAINIVGMSHIRARALSICMSNAFSLPPSLNRLAFWRNSMVCAGYCQWLAQSVGVDKQQAWLTGMMLRLGELIIAKHSPAMIDPIEKKPCQPGERWIRELNVAGFDEGQIMAEVANRWDFPDAVVQALNASAHPLSEVPFSLLSAVIHLAALLTDSEKYPADLEKLFPAEVVQRLSLNLAELQARQPDPETFSDISMMNV